MLIKVSLENKGDIYIDIPEGVTASEAMQKIAMRYNGILAMVSVEGRGIPFCAVEANSALDSAATLERVCVGMGLSSLTLRDTSRSTARVQAIRRIIYYTLRNKYRYSYVEIAKLTHRHHTNVLQTLQKFEPSAADKKQIETLWKYLDEGVK